MPDAAADPLKLIALDADDLAIVSAHLQDSVLKVADLVYLPREQRFALAARRFDWEGAQHGACRRRLNGAPDIVDARQGADQEQEAAEGAGDVGGVLEDEGEIEGHACPRATRRSSTVPTPAITALMAR